MISLMPKRYIWKLLKLTFSAALFVTLTYTLWGLASLDVIGFNRPLYPNYSLRKKAMDSVQNIFRDDTWYNTSGLDMHKNETSEHVPLQLPPFDNSTDRKSQGFENVQLPPFVNSTDRSGPGQNGKAVVIKDTTLTKKERDEMREGWKAHNFNEFVNRKISVRRSLPECSNSACRGLINGTKTTQQISVVLIFHNEAWCTLLRSVHSILDRTPEHILEEVVLVDDMSSLDSNKAPLDKYFQDYPQVKIVRSPVRGGLTKARLLGFESSIAPIVVFLDSHIECMPGWAEPLVIRIEEDPTAVVYPLIETISDKTFAVTCTPQPTNIGRLNIMNLLFQWMPIPQREKDRRKSDADPVRSPTMPGGLFAISRDYFNKLGTYDPDLTYWGGENMELSFKVWQCGGSVELVPCSHIAHVFRHHITARWNSTRDEVKVNNMRVAEVWMDDYKNYYYEAINYVQVPFGDISARKKLREDLSCKSFGWFIKNFYPEFALPLDVVRGGHITSEFFPTPMCVDSKGGTVKPELYQCHPQSGNQIWFLNKAGVLSFDKLFVCGKEDGTVSLSKPNPCPGEGPQWEFTDDNSLLHLPTDLCLTVTQGSNEITLESCEDETNQHWIFPLRRTDIVFPVPDLSDV